MDDMELSQNTVWYGMYLPTHHFAMNRTLYFYEILLISFTLYSERHFVEQKIRNLVVYSAWCQS